MGALSLDKSRKLLQNDMKNTLRDCFTETRHNEMPGKIGMFRWNYIESLICKVTGGKRCGI